MAKTTIVQVTDDLDGAKNAQEVRFSFQGIDYSIDLSAKNLAAFEKAMKPFIEAATKEPKRAARSTSRRSSRSSSGKHDLAAVREWARGVGIEVSERGRVASSVIEQYEVAHEAR